MKKIIFRGRDIQDIWRHGSLIIDEVPIIGTQYIIVQDRVQYVLPDNSTIGQFTGLTDKNGKEIYEGDIIKTHNQHNDEFIDIVVWSECFLQFEIKETKKTMCPDLSLYKYSGCEIIGNIHDNLELLTSK